MKQIQPILIPLQNKEFLPAQVQADLLLTYFNSNIPTPSRIGLIFSANLRQLRNAQKIYGNRFSKQGGSTQIKGSNQAKVFMKIESSLQKPKYSSLCLRYYTIPLPTMKYTTRACSLETEEIDEGIQYLERFLALEDSRLFVLMRRTSDGVEPAIGGGKAKIVAADYIERIQQHVQEKLADELVILE